MGKCRPEGSNTFCFLNRSPSIAGHKTQTDLYFRGHGDDAPLIEISVGVWDCQVDPVRSDLQKKLGEPAQTANKRARWNLKKMTVIALLPKDKNLCMVHFLDNSDTKRIESLFPGNAASEVSAPKKTTAPVKAIETVSDDAGAAAKTAPEAAVPTAVPTP
jgi:hypothetical protein